MFACQCPEGWKTLPACLRGLRPCNGRMLASLADLQPGFSPTWPTKAQLTRAKQGGVKACRGPPLPCSRHRGSHFLPKHQGDPRRSKEIQRVLEVMNWCSESLRHVRLAVRVQIPRSSVDRGCAEKDFPILHVWTVWLCQRRMAQLQQVKSPCPERSWSSSTSANPGEELVIKRGRRHANASTFRRGKN